MKDNLDGTEAIRTLPNNTPPDVVPLLAPTSVAEWRLHQSQLPPHPEALTIPQASNPPESVLSTTSGFSALLSYEFTN
jgi:hypothetical protein